MSTVTKKKSTKNPTCSYRMGHDSRYTAVWTAAMSGDRGALRALGIPVITQHRFPLAFEKTRWWIDDETKIVRAVLVPELKPFDPGFDVVDFFMTLHRKSGLPLVGEKSGLPLVAENNVLKFLMALAAPLIRQLAPGLIGAFWFLGPSGGCKEFLQNVVAGVHMRALKHPPAHAIAELKVKDELQMERTFHDNRSAIYIRSTEIGKRVQLIDSFIHFTAAPTIAIKGLYKSEVFIPNSFCYLADSVENLPQRREIERRTVTIDVKKAERSTSLGKLMETIFAKAPDIVAALIRILEDKEKNWYLHQPDLQGRPLLQQGLARLFGVTLDEIRGRSMDDMFEAMSIYVVAETGKDREDEGKIQQKKCRDSDGLGAKELPNYRYSHFSETMTNRFNEGGRARDPQGFGQLFAEFPSADRLRTVLDREVEYTKVGRGGQRYLPVVVGGERYAFRFVRNGRNFIFCGEDEFCSKVGGPRISSPEMTEPSAKVLKSGAAKTNTDQPPPILPPPDYNDFPPGGDNG